MAAQQLPSDPFGYFLVSLTPGSSMPPGSDGVPCLAGSIGRANQAGRIFQGPAGHVSLDLASMPVSPPPPVLPGETWYFQAWHRDGSSSNFTDAIAILYP